jgi:predicted dehydrogenase
MHAHSSLEDVAYLRLSYADLGVSANAHVSWLDPCKVRRVTVVGSERMVVYNDLATEERIRVYDKGVVQGSEADPETLAPASYRYGDISSPFVQFEEPLMVQDREFVEAVEQGLGPVAAPHTGALVVDALEAAERSLREGRPVVVDDVRRLAPVKVG